MARLPMATRESVPEAQRAIFDEMVEGLGSVPRYSPGSVMIHVPTGAVRSPRGVVEGLAVQKSHLR